MHQYCWLVALWTRRIRQRVPTRKCARPGCGGEYPVRRYRYDTLRQTGWPLYRVARLTSWCRTRPGANPVPGEGSGCSASRSSAQRDRCARSAWARKWASGCLESEPPRRGAQEERVAALGKVPHTSLSCWSVDNPANSGPGLTVARSNLASVLRGAPWPPSCCSSRVNHGELRARIRELIAPGDLPAVPPLASGTLSALRG